MTKKYRFETDAVRKQAERSVHREHSVPIYETSSYIFHTAEEARAVFAEEITGNVYGRYSNPNSDEFIAKLCSMEGAEDGLATSSGMAALFLCINGLLRPGDHILAGRQLFGTTHLLLTQVLPRWGVSHSYADLGNQEEWEDSVLPTTRMILAESPSNPGLQIANIKWLSKLAKKNNLYLLIDNSFATPYLQNPLNLGADLVFHSTTKFIDGQGRTLGGAVTGSAEIIGELRSVYRITGPSMSPFTAWILSKSLETLAARMDRHCKNAMKLALFLEENSEIKMVNYPYLPSHPQYKLARMQMKHGGGLVTFELKGGLKRACKFIDSLKIASICSNLGDSRTIVTHPFTTTHSKLLPEEKKLAGITDGLIRVSAGLENIDDIMEDFGQAIQVSKAKTRK